MNHPETLLHTFTSITKPLRLGELFLKPHPMELEIGCGDGGFLLGHAKTHPDRNFLGVERLLGRIRKLDKKGRRASLRNLRLLRIEARYLIEHLLPENTFDAIHIYFPDPWPKDKHTRHRLINETFPGHAERLLQPSGIIHLRTDSVPYFEQMQTVFPAHGAFKEESTPAALKARVTEFESEFNAQGIPTNHASWRLATS